MDALFKRPKPVLVININGALSDDAVKDIGAAFDAHPVNTDYHVLVLPVGLSAEIHVAGTGAQKRETR
jgi:hypothetical protein